MTVPHKIVRQSVSLPFHLVRRIRDLAKSRCTSASKVLLDLIEKGIENQEQEKAKFFSLADALAASKDPEEIKHLKAQLAKITFGC